eukprot:TRINITY_DN26200_c1_g1_i1.p1 TRINITY_DN26200_c1_g1~~TRINITY_DN26200_c1_g1_i1.p1  ORF type:complete len:270 (-),score=5.45 TRINITY_DN26200_c1_g1_i1:162-971(-)
MRLTNWSCRIALPGLSVLALAGCTNPNLGDYRPVNQVQSSSLPSEVETADSEAGRATISTASDQGASIVEEEIPVSALGPVNVIDGAGVANLMKIVPSDAAPPPANPIQPASATSAAVPGKHTYEVLVPDKSFQRDASSKALRVSYDDLDLLKVINLEPVPENAVELMPAWLKELSGQRIRLRGFMFPTFEAEGIERFVLARDNQICCFGRDPKVYDLVQVDMRHGKTTNYIPATRAFDVIGKFKIEMDSIDGKPFGLYYIEDAEIIDR